MPSTQEYEKAHKEYRAAAVASRADRNDDKAREAKISAHKEVIKMERQAMREGVVLEAHITGSDTVRVSANEGGPTKRSLQEEYCRKFDNETQVMLPGRDGQPQQTTLRKYHEQRLLARR